MKILLDDQKIKEDPKDSSGPIGQGRIIRLVKDMTEQIKILFRKPLLYMTVLTSLMLFTNMYGYVTLAEIILLEYLTKKEIVLDFMD